MPRRFLLAATLLADAVAVCGSTAECGPEVAGEEKLVGLESAPTVKTLLQDKRVLYVSAPKIKPIADPAAPPVPGGAAKPEATIETVVIVFAGTDADAEVI